MKRILFFVIVAIFLNGCETLTGIHGYSPPGRNEAAEKQAEQIRRDKAYKLYNEFNDKYGVDVWVSTERLSANPFVFKDMTVAIAVVFSSMLSPTKGIFKGGEYGLSSFVVSNIPEGLFTSKIPVLLAGRVLGGTTLAPNLEFVGAHFCEFPFFSDCIDMSIIFENWLEGYKLREDYRNLYNIYYNIYK